MLAKFSPMSLSAFCTYGIEDKHNTSCQISAERAMNCSIAGSKKLENDNPRFKPGNHSGDLAVLEYIAVDKGCDTGKTSDASEHVLISVVPVFHLLHALLVSDHER